MPEHPHFIWSDLFRRRKDEKYTIQKALRQNVLFCTLSKAEIKQLASIIYERVYQQDEPVFHQNDRGYGMYIIVKGKIAIKTHAPDGENLVTYLQGGSFFGELSLIEADNIRTASAVAVEQTVIAGFFKPDLMEILERNPSMGVKILYQLATVLGKRLMETTEKITELKDALGKAS